MDGSSLRIIKRGLPLIGLVLFGYVVHTLDMDAVMAMVGQARWPYLLCGMAVMLLFLWAKAFRHYWILRSQGIDIPPGRVMGIFFRSAFWGFVSPGRVGEFSKVLYLDDYVDSKGKSIANVFIDRILDLLCILLILLGAATVAAIPRKWETNSLAAAVLIGGLLLLFFLSLFWGRRNTGRFPGPRGVFPGVPAFEEQDASARVQSGYLDVLLFRTIPVFQEHRIADRLLVYRFLLGKFEPRGHGAGLHRRHRHA